MPDWLSADCSNHACIEVQDAPNAVLLRVTADPEQVLVAKRAEFTAFVAGCKAGRFDHLTDAPADADDLAAEVGRLTGALTDLVVKATPFGTQDGDFIATYIVPTGPIHRAIPILDAHGIHARPGYDPRTAALFPPATRPTQEA